METKTKQGDRKREKMKMRSITTKPNKYGWYYTFRATKNQLVIIYKRQNQGKMIFNENTVHIFENEDGDVLDNFFTIVEEYKKMRMK